MSNQSYLVRRWKRILFRFFLVSGGCVAGLFLAELGLWFVGYGLGTDSAYQPDPYCGARHVPRYRGWHTQEGRSWIEMNSHGFRDRERTLEKPPDTFRVAVIGDSFAEALQVDLDKTFWMVMERLFAESRPFNGQRVEVLNFGVAGYGTAQELEMLRHYVWDYQPDLIMLQFLAGNDIANNSRKLEQQTGRPFYTLEADRLVLDNSFLQDLERVCFQTSTWIKLKDFVVHNSRVAAMIYQIRHQQRAPEIKEGTEVGLAMQPFCEPDSFDWKNAWAVTDRLVVEMAREAESHGAKFVVLMANNGVEVEPNNSVFEGVVGRLGVADLLYPERRLEALAAQHGFAVIRLAQAMRQYSQEHQVYLHGFANTRMGTGHWNEAGHRLAGELAAAHLLEIGLVPGVQ